jgi:PAS domain S-box-containing protein
MRIQRFTPAVTQIVPLIQTDVGRPLGNIVANIPGYKHLMDDAREVLDTLIPKELEIRTHDGQFYLLRIRPYRTLGNVIEGVVITFVDISSNRRAQTASMQAEASLRLLFDATPLGVIFHDGEGRITDANTAAEKMLGWSVDQLRGFSCNDTRWGLFAEDGTSLPPERHPVIRAIQDGEPVMESVLGIRSPFAGDIHWVSVNVIPQNHPDEKRPYRVCATLRPVNPPQNEVTRP